MRKDLSQLWQASLAEVDPLELFHKTSRSPETACLLWGKAAGRTLQALRGRSRGPILVISTEQPPAFLSQPRYRHVKWIRGEHPLPGPGSLAAGRAVLEFFDSLRRWKVRCLDVYLSGGASSTAWLPRGKSFTAIRARLEKLYREPLTIQELNDARSELCSLKGGDAARWLAFLSPLTRVQVYVISDVAPFGPEVVGSGPFWDGKTPHHVMADNAALVRAAVREARRSRRGARVLHASGKVLPVQDCAEGLLAEIDELVRLDREALVILGCEPLLELPRSAGHGGRMGHLAALLLHRIPDAFASGRVSGLFGSSDGSDGNSDSAGASIDTRVLARVAQFDPRLQGLGRALSRFDTAPWLRKAGALLPRQMTGTNVQDLVILSISRG